MLLTPTNQRGFTLIEMLMAMVVFAMLALSSAAVLQQTIQTDEISRTSQQRLKSLQRTMTMIERDFGQMVGRGSRNSFGEVSNQLFEYGDNYADSDGQGIRFHRLGWLNPQGRLPRGSVQQVIYRLREQKLQRLYTLYPDPVEGEEPIELELMDEVLDLQFAFYIDGSWVTQTDGQQFPQAVAVEIELADLGKIRRHILLADGVGSSDESEQQEGTGNNGNNNSNNNGSGNG
ncbi:type II secretion system minor pseudopilin GspJ [uncultured Ferrimonas sp.]|uniref:type II secretion system minor pseudopilin GspJ n=1 Tax=uncultured Ferrimonas sp. TaxID=432640 RepID=UPI00261D3C29|nr:type II secretion system minor pseudopilin GspJ [uncultured Ferrimonas sp.]